MAFIPCPPGKPLHFSQGGRTEFVAFFQQVMKLVDELVTSAYLRLHRKAHLCAAPRSSRVFLPTDKRPRTSFSASARLPSAQAGTWSTSIRRSFPESPRAV